MESLGILLENARIAVHQVAGVAVVEVVVEEGVQVFIFLCYYGFSYSDDDSLALSE